MSAIPYVLRRAGAVLGSAVVVTSWLTPTAAVAAPPPNDNPRTAAQVAAVPATISADTREATTDRVRRECVRGHSVWYRYSPAQTGRVRVVTIGSSFDTLLAVYRGATAPRAEVACNDDAAGVTSASRVRFVAGRQYWIAVSSCCDGRAAAGGDLALRMYASGTPAAQVTVTGARTDPDTRMLWVRGTATCGTPALLGGAVVAEQRLGERVARARAGFTVRACVPEHPTSWIAHLASGTGTAFRAGHAVDVAVDVTADDGFGESTDGVRTTLSVTEDPGGGIVP